MNDDVESGTIASLLDSGATLASASNAAAVIAGLGCVFAHPTVARAAFVAAILLWFVQSWLALRTRADASLFRMLAQEPESRGSRMDGFLVAWGLRKNTRERSIGERCKAALRLWRMQIGALVIQCCALVCGLIWVLLAGTP